MTGLIRVCTVILRDGADRILTVRKRGTDWFMLPGGKPEPGETSRQAAVRECAEELSVTLDTEALRELGTFRGVAANETGREVESTVFAHPPVTVGRPAAEIEELRWLDLRADPLPTDLAPLLFGQVVPALRRKA
ncbi:NUDIX hydrolase [Microlunatus parietis]|uniref:8-oxo-dGTP pyrophosphatase MutT (NUDIX family) n=1 Tax=Microlunatus parietis TaxID=682979 RepID=A0A7Y9LAJ0_9ACTN|nr:NUDIX domain-containing protein [Microlunatus parietis]NYE70742.1 8-oxo-dGTP pyrophosphatase MutT (NUDIX family) [Microlunatus parietis]